MVRFFGACSIRRNSMEGGAPRRRHPAAERDAATTVAETTKIKRCRAALSVWEAIDRFMAQHTEGKSGPPQLAFDSTGWTRHR